MKFLLVFTLIALTIPIVFSTDAPRVKIRVMKRIDGCTRRSKNGDILFVLYKGSLENGTVFDTNYPDGPPYRFPLGSNAVIKGWDIGLHNMCVREKRHLIIPPEFAYGDEGSGQLIPPKAVLHFEIELTKLHHNIEL